MYFDPLLYVVMYRVLTQGCKGVLKDVRGYLGLLGFRMWGLGCRVQGLDFQGLGLLGVCGVPYTLDPQP